MKPLSSDIDDQYLRLTISTYVSEAIAGGYSADTELTNLVTYVSDLFWTAYHEQTQED
jgi:hypothetical protein